MAGIEEKMTLTRKQILSLILLLALLFALPFAIFLTKIRQDIRPRALAGKANLLLSADTVNATAGANLQVLVSLQVTDARVRVSAADFILLYDKNKLEVTNLVPAVQSSGLPASFFTDVPVLTYGGNFDKDFNFLRVSEVARMPEASLPGGTMTLAKVTFRPIKEGAAVIKFPDDNKYLEVVGTGPK